MKPNRETINAKLRAYSTDRGTLQAIFDEIEAFFENLQQLKQNFENQAKDSLLIRDTVKDRIKLLKEILAENQLLEEVKYTTLEIPKDLKDALQKEGEN